MPRHQKKSLIVNFIGGLMYLSCTLQWLWATLPYLPSVTRFLEVIQPTVTQQEPLTPVVHSNPPSLITILIASIVTIALLALTAYILVRLPFTIAKTGQKITKRTADYAVPLLAHHKKLTPKKRQHLTARVLLTVKLLLCTLPVVITALSIGITVDIPYDLFMLIAASLGIGSLTLLSIELCLARLLKQRLSSKM